MAITPAKPPNPGWYLRPPGIAQKQAMTAKEKAAEDLKAGRDRARWKIFEKLRKGRLTWQDVKFYFMRFSGPAAVLAIDEYIREQKLDPHGYTHLADLGAILYSAYAAGKIAKEARRKKKEALQKKRREKEDVIRNFVDGYYDSFGVAIMSKRLGQYPLLLRSPQAAPLVRQLPPGTKVRKIPKLPLEAKEVIKREAADVGDYMAKEASLGANRLFPELTKTRLTLKHGIFTYRGFNSVSEVLKFVYRQNPEHTKKAVGLANLVVRAYGRFVDDPRMPAPIRKRITDVYRLSKEIVDEASRRRIPAVEVTPPRSFEYMLFSNRLEKELTKTPKPDVKLAEMYQFLAGTIK